MFSLGTVAVHRQAWDGTISICPVSDVTSTEVSVKSYVLLPLSKVLQRAL